MSVLVGYLENGDVCVMGTDDPKLARSVMIETLIEREELDNFGVCVGSEDEEKGFCDLTNTDLLCDRCRDFLATIYSVSEVHSYPAFYWKEM